MGITIHYNLAQQKQFVETNLDNTQKYAKLLKKHEANPLKISFKIQRLSKTKLFIDIGGCETLAFNFKPLSYWKKESKKGWNLEWAMLEKLQPLDTDENADHYKEYPEQVLLWNSNFCKTQFGQKIEHKWVANILQSLASRMEIAIIHDEGDFYYTNDLEKAEESKQELSRMIGKVKGMLLDSGFKEENIVEGQSIIDKAKND